MAAPAVPAMRDDWLISYHNPVFGLVSVPLRLDLTPAVGHVLYFQHVLAGRWRYSVCGTVECIDDRRGLLLARFGLRVEVVV